MDFREREFHALDEYHTQDTMLVEMHLRQSGSNETHC